MIANQQTQIGVKYVDNPRRFGVAETKDGQITHLVEKPEEPKSNLAIVGLYYITQPRLLVECLDEMIKGNKRTKDEFQLTDALQMMIERGEQMKPFPVEGWFDCGKPETLLSTNQHLLEFSAGAITYTGRRYSTTGIYFRESKSEQRNYWTECNDRR